ncbi:hypothetical protein GUJ93_ZPchr0005g14450 [Zizania palustris]|uniref:Uncharacterized protein n=1 Tax=Zizania palustris TaxID=103762 RepID=A0A8J5T8Z0_ZIZPA|nr:hypothetical protein GUJ93_ZPchr0005g14450 [Zizania palustris]
MTLRTASPRRTARTVHPCTRATDRPSPGRWIGDPRTGVHTARGRHGSDQGDRGASSPSPATAATAHGGTIVSTSAKNGERTRWGARGYLGRRVRVDGGGALPAAGRPSEVGAEVARATGSAEVSAAGAEAVSGDGEERLEAMAASSGRSESWRNEEGFALLHGAAIFVERQENSIAEDIRNFHRGASEAVQF